MNRKHLEQCAWDHTPPEERRDHTEHRVLPKYRKKDGQRVRVSEGRQRVRKLTGNNREVRVFDPSGSTPGTMSPWRPLWSLYNDELAQRCEQGHEPKLRAPYTRVRRDYKNSIESVADTKQHHATKSKKSPAQLQREINEVLAKPGTSSIRLPPGAPAAWAHRHLSEAKTPNELAAIWRLMMNHWTGMGRYYASLTGVAQSEINSVYQQHRARLGAR